MSLVNTNWPVAVKNSKIPSLVLRARARVETKLSRRQTKDLRRSKLLRVDLEGQRGSAWGTPRPEQTGAEKGRRRVRRRSFNSNVVEVVDVVTAAAAGLP